MNDPNKCGVCGGEMISSKKDVGCDIDPSGEEKQHLNICLGCGAQQLWVERWHDFVEYKVHHGKWFKKEDCPPWHY